MSIYKLATISKCFVNPLRSGKSSSNALYKYPSLSTKGNLWSFRILEYIKRQTNSNIDSTLKVLLIVLLGGDVRNRFDETLGKVAIPDVMNIKVRIFR